jgi:negative regulator of flagellin synthesis FlgM
MSINFNVNNVARVNNIYKSGVSSKYEAQAKSSTKKDEIDISTIARDYQTLARALSETPDIRENIVNDLKAQFESGNYVININKIADAILD